MRFSLPQLLAPVALLGLLAFTEASSPLPHKTKPLPKNAVAAPTGAAAQPTTP
ncbi:MAG: hypothetical protein ACRYFZ_04500 [Janthinobacterium lividum]